MSKSQRGSSNATTVRVTKKSQRRLPARGNGSAARGRTWKARSFTAALVVIFAALVVVSATRSGSGSGGAGAPASAGAPTGGGNPGGLVSPLTLTSLDGRSVSIPSTGRPGALFFTVSSCSSCIPSAQALSTLKSQLGTRADVLMVDLDPQDSSQNLRAWGDAVGNPSYPLAIDTTGNLVNQYQVQALGTTVIYDAKGRIVDRLIEPGMGELAGAFRKAGVA